MNVLGKMETYKLVKSNKKMGGSEPLAPDSLQQPSQFQNQITDAYNRAVEIGKKGQELVNTGISQIGPFGEKVKGYVNGVIVSRPQPEQYSHTI